MFLAQSTTKDYITGLNTNFNLSPSPSYSAQPVTKPQHYVLGAALVENENVQIQGAILVENENV